MDRISIANPVFNGNEKKYLNECIDTGWISANGRFVSEFEKRFAEFCGTKYALTCANGTVSLHLILAAMGIGPGDEVIMPALTYIATANAVRYCGATPGSLCGTSHSKKSRGGGSGRRGSRAGGIRHRRGGAGVLRTIPIK